MTRTSSPLGNLYSARLLIFLRAPSFHQGNNQLFILSDAGMGKTSFLAMLKLLQDMFFKKEAGGILLGYRRGVHIHVSDATGPQKKDIRTRFSFNRIDRYHQRYAEELWNRSGEIVGYLGEWHTHPEQSPKPSSIDIGDWLRITKAQGSSCIFIIGAAGPANFHLSCVFEEVIKECEVSR